MAILYGDIPNLTQEAIAQKIKNVFAVYNDIKVQSVGI